MIVKNNALIMAVNNPAPILGVLPKAKLIRFKGKELVVVKHTLENAKVLNNLGLNAPSPILHGAYEFTGRYTPFEKQLVTAEFFTLNNRAYCFNQMRTGKTGAALWALDYLKKGGYLNKVLVVCPIDVMDVWVNEAFAVVPHLNITQVVGTPEKKAKLLQAPADIYVMGFDALRGMYHEEYFPNSNKIKRKWHDLEGLFDLVIADEASAYCKATNWRWKAIRQLVKPETNLWMLTGTPISNAPTDAYGLVKLMQPSKIPASFTLFEETLMRKVGPYKKVPRDGAIDAVYKLMQPAIRFTRAENTDLPTTVQARPCTMSTEQEKVFNDIKNEMLHEAEESDVTAQNAAVKLIKLQQVMCGVVKDDDGNPIELNPKSRLSVMEGLIREANAKVVIFVPFIHSMHTIQNYLHSKHIRSEIVNGTVSKNERREIIARFKNDAKQDVLIAHPKIMAHGQDFTCADTFIWYAPTFSIEQYQQANARGEGPNKSLPVGIYHIGCHPVEWRIYEVLKSKGSMQDQLLDLYQVILS
jgi:SNF2 family DNA or RNA helicase